MLVNMYFWQGKMFYQKKKIARKTNWYCPSNLLIKDYRFTELKKEVEEKNKSHPEESIAERVELKKTKSIR